MPFLSDYPQIKIIQTIAKQKNVAVYLVGGYLRDRQLGIDSKDFDFAVQRDALGVARSFSRKIKGAYILLDEARGCARVAKRVSGELFVFDFADYRARTIEEDLALRDFTINTLSLDLAKLKASSEISDVLVDIKRGLGDIRKKSIKRTSLGVFRDDPLRMMRAFSLKASLGFKIDPPTLIQIRKEKGLICDVSYERIREELFKILETDKSAATLRAMDKIGLLEKVIPQVKVMFGCKQGTYHHLDVWPHSLETVAQLEKVYQQVKGNQDVASYLLENLGGHRSRLALMKLAALLHDIGKPDTRKKEKERVSFHGHEHVGKNIVRHIAKMLKLSVRERHALEDMVQWHLRPGYLSNFKQPSEKAVYRYYRDTKDEAASILLLSLADQRSTRGPATTQNDQEHHEKICLNLVDGYFGRKKEKPFARLITGHDLIQKLKLKPSPVFARILAEVEEKQSLGKIKTKKEALAVAKALAGKA